MDEARGHLVAGRLDEAISAYEVLLTGGLDDSDASRANNNLCVAHIRLGQPHTAEAFCRAAIELRADDPTGRTRSLSNLAWALRKLGQTDEAVATYQEALQLGSTAGLDSSVAIIENNLSGLELFRDRPAAALRHAAAARRVASVDAPWASRQLATAWLNEATAWDHLGQHHRALEAVAHLDTKLVPADLLPAAELRRGVARRGLGMPYRSLEHYAAAAEGFDTIGDQAGRATALLDRALVLADELGRPEEGVAPLRQALDVGDADVTVLASHHLGRVLTELGRIDEAERLHDAGLARAETLNQPAALRAHLAGLARVHMARGQNAEALTTLRRATAILPRQALAEPDQDLVMRTLDLLGDRDAAEALALIDRLQGGLGSVDAIRTAVGDDTLIAYAVTGTQVLAVKVDHGLTLSRLGPPPTLEEGCVAGDCDMSRLPLLAPLAVAPRRLIVAPGTALRSVPFDMLTGPGGVSLVQTTAVVHVRAPSEWSAPKEEVLPASWLGVGLTTRSQAGDWSTPDLPNAEPEVRDSAARWPGSTRTLLGRNASPEGLIKALRSAGAIHIAAHAVLPAIDVPSVILLEPDASHPQGRLDTAELDASHLRLAVLASCGTARPSEPTLAWGLMDGGAQAVVGTLWDVDDAATSAFMAQFYEGLARGASASEALHHAKRRMAAHPGWSEPRHWAAFVLYGDTGPFAPRRPPWHLLFVLAGVGLGGLAWRGRPT